MMIQPRHDSIQASATAVDGSAFDDAAAIDGAYRLLTIRGLSSVEAGNVVAYVVGLRPAERGWTVDEIKHLVAIRSFVARGVIES
jgi:hypothetical protein